MIGVKLSDGRVLQFPDGTDQATMKQAINSLIMRERADAAKAGTLELQPGSAERAAAMNEMAMKAMNVQNLPPPQGQTSLGVLSSMLGVEPQTAQPQEKTLSQRALELGTGLGAATVRGASSLIGLPGTLDDLVNAGLKKVGLIPENVPPSRISGQAIQSALNDITGGYVNYKAPGFLGGATSTGGELLGGGAGGKVSALGGLLSEGLGYATEGSFLEPAARLAGVIAPAFLTGKPGAFIGDDETARMANVLREAGVDVSTGQGLQSQALMGLEGRLQATDDQLKAFTASTMQQLGSTAKLATPENLAATQKFIVKQMDDAVAGINVIPSTANASAALKIATDYVGRVPAGQLTPRVRGIANEIKAFEKSGKEISLERLKQWRSDIGSLTVSSDAATRTAAHDLRTLLDGMTDEALTAAGRADDIFALAKAREAYRNFIGVRDAASRATAEGGILSPTQLNQSMIRAQGREAYATGTSTPMTDFTRSAAAILRPAPATSPGGVRRISEALPIALATLAGGAGYQAGLGPVAAGLAAAAGAVAPAASQIAMRFAPLQSLVRNPVRAIAETARVAPGLLSQDRR
jgi:hypothetical protein